MSAVLLDYSGVIARPTGDDARALIEKAVGATGFWDEFAELRPQLLTGAIDDTRFYNRLAGRAELPLFDVDEAVAADWAGFLDLADDTVAAALGLQAAGTKVGVLADVSPGLAGHLRRRLPWLGTSVAAVFSCDIGLETVDERAFAVACDVLGASAPKTTFFSRSPARLTAARGHGLTAVDYTGPHQLKEHVK